jgi:hypothetical protein
MTASERYSIAPFGEESKVPVQTELTTKSSQFMKRQHQNVIAKHHLENETK